MIFVDDIHKHNLQLVPTIHQISHRSAQFLYKSSLKGKKKRKKKYELKKKVIHEKRHARVHVRLTTPTHAKRNLTTSYTALNARHRGTIFRSHC